MHPLWSTVLALLLAAVFGFAAVGKFLAWAEWPGVVRNFRLLPGWLADPVAWLLPPLELGAAVALLVPACRSAAAVLGVALLSGFTLALAVNLARGRREIDCGCFRSGLRQTLSGAVIVRNLLLVTAALLLIPQSTAVPGSALEWLIAVGAAGTLTLLYLSVGLAFQAPPPVLR